MEDAADRIDPLPAPTACVDGVQRHMQQYEQTISALQLENQELRARLRQVLAQLDVLQQQPGQQCAFQAVSAPVTQTQVPINAAASVQAPLTAIQPSQSIAVSSFVPRPRRVQLHTRRILQVSTYNQHLLSVSQDGTARVISTEGQSLYCFRADAQVRACLLDSRLLCWCTQRKLSFHSLERIPRLEPYADVSDLNQTLLRDPSGQVYFALQASPQCICRSGTRFYVFMSGLVAVLEASAQGFSAVTQQAFSDEQNPQFDFACAAALDGRVYAVLRNGQRCSRVVELSDQLSCRAFQLRADYNIVQLLPLPRALLCLCGPALKFALIGQNGQVVELPEQASELPTCACVDSMRVFIATLLGDRVFILIYHIDQNGDSYVLKREKAFQLEEFLGIVTSICVRDQTLVLGSSAGEIIVRVWQ